jgi:hypothetical protein
VPLARQNVEKSFKEAQPLMVGSEVFPSSMKCRDCRHPQRSWTEHYREQVTPSHQAPYEWIRIGMKPFVCALIVSEYFLTFLTGQSIFKIARCVQVSSMAGTTITAENAVSVRYHSLHP